MAAQTGGNGGRGGTGSGGGDTGSGNGGGDGGTTKAVAAPLVRAAGR